MPQSIGLSDIEFRKKYRLPTSNKNTATAELTELHYVLIVLMAEAVDGF